MRCIRDENGKVLFEDAEIKERWQKYFSNILNGEGMEDSRSRDREWGERSADPRECGLISKVEIREVMRKMPNGKAEGPDQMPVEVWSVWVRKVWSSSRSFSMLFLGPLRCPKN